MKRRDRATLKDMIARSTLVPVPLVFNALSALMAQQAGFQVACVGGGALGYIRAVTAAALTPLDFVGVTEIRTATYLPLIADGGCGWGDLVHMRRFIRLAIAAGYNAIETEDQVVVSLRHEARRPRKFASYASLKSGLTALPGVGSSIRFPKSFHSRVSK